MRLRWILAAFGVAFASLALAVAAAARVVWVQTSMVGIDVSQYTQEELDAWSRELNASWIWIGHVPWLATAAFIALAVSLALLARRAQLRQRASASATASRDASRS